ncbi:MAG: nuclear transport factor 2 family protein [Mycobacterium sp.]
MHLDAIAFSQQRVQAWNGHDVEAVLRYWTAAVQRFPGLRFAVEGVYQGIDTLVITYRNQNDDLVNEVLTFKDGVIIEGHGTYLVPA